jgi:UDP-N-acetylmuramoylalanine-D-glutamate ligase
MAYHLEKFYATNAILTNLHTDHLDWHRDIDEYYHAKLNLLARTKETIVYPQSVLTLLPELRDFPLQAFTIPENIPLEHELLALSSETFLDVSGIQLF